MRFQELYCFSAFGVNVCIEAEDRELRELAKEIAAKATVGNARDTDILPENADHVFKVYRDDSGLIFEDDLGPSGSIRNIADFRRSLNSMIRVRVGVKSRDWLFVHAGVVGYRGKAIVIPGNSNSGKTTLVAALVKEGCEYYSDEYAVFSESGQVYPYARDLSVRIGSSANVVELPVGDIGGSAGSKELEVGLVLFTSYSENGVWAPESISLGQGILETIPHALPIRFHTEFALKVLNTAFSRAIIARSIRGEARVTAPEIIALLRDN